jgi:hypothetical protein
MEVISARLPTCPSVCDISHNHIKINAETFNKICQNFKLFSVLNYNAVHLT